MNIKIYKLSSLLVIFAFTAFSFKLQAAPEPYEEVFEFGNFSSICNGLGPVTGAFYLKENFTYSNCNTREFKLGFYENTTYMKCVSFEWVVTGTQFGASSVVASGTIGNSFFNQAPHIYDYFNIHTPSDPENWTYTISMTQYDIEGCNGTYCYIPSFTLSPSFIPNWSALPDNRTFSLDADFSHETSMIPPGGFPTHLKCNSEAMEFNLNQEVVDDLNCYYGGPINSQWSCSEANAGLTITKTDINHNPIDNPKYLGTQEWANQLGVGSSSDFVLEDFIDNNGNTENIALLPLFGNYMTSNYGYYTLEFTYQSLCGSYLERMFIEYGTTYKPTFNFAEALSGGSFAMNQVPTNTSFTNPFVSCQSSSIMNLTNVSSNINSNNPLRIIVERFDNTTGNSDGIIVDITFSNWNAAGMVNLRNYAWGDPVVTPPSCTSCPSNGYASYYNNWSGWPPFILAFLEPGNIGLTANYYDNQDDIYNIRLEYTTVCGTETAEMWFSPTSATCKMGYDDIANIKRTSSLYPNPTKSEINIAYFNLDENSTISIFNVTGQKVFEEIYKVSTFKIDEKINLDFLNNGIYFIEFESVNGKETHKIVKQ